MTFLTLQQELADRLGAYNQSVAADATKLKRWLNMGQQYICGKRLWSFMMKEEIVQTVTDITTGTVTISAGASTGTFSSAPTVSVQDRYIQVSTSNDWYQITSHTASSTSFTISPAFVGTSTLTAGTYTVRKLLYTTTTPLISIFDMKQLITPTNMPSISPWSSDFLLPLYYATGTPYFYVMSSPTSVGTPQWSFLYSPSSVLNVMIRGVRVLADMSADADVSLIPAPWHDALVNIGAYYGFQSMDDSRADRELEVGELRISDMATTYTQDPGRHRVMQGVDDRNQTSGIQWSFPYIFGQ